jgi:hypothetical protein
MSRVSRIFVSVLSAACAAALGACQATPELTGGTPAPSPFRPATGDVLSGDPEGIEEAYAIAAREAEARRQRIAGQTFEAFEASVRRDPDGKYIVNGDIAIFDRKQLLEFFETHIQVNPREAIQGGLVVHTVGGQDATWNATQKRNLSYCVSTSFGARHADVVAQLEAATGAWEAVADVNFQYVASQDAACTATNPSVVFDVRPVSNAGYLARAFFPNEPRAARNVLIDASSFQLAPPPSKLQLSGILRHELGHTLGFRHEHTRPESGACFEDDHWRPLTSYDGLSVMHYPQCNGGGDWSLALTPRDQNGAACLYGEAPGFTTDPTLCQEPPEPVEPACGPRTQSFTLQSVAKNEEKPYGPFAVSQGTTFEAKLTGSGASPGDPDLYVRFDAAPTRTPPKFTCRPFLSGAEESCAPSVPAGTTQAFVMVHGYSAGRYELTVTHTP